jgi:hypothetical protein
MLLIVIHRLLWRTEAAFTPAALLIIDKSLLFYAQELCWRAGGRTAAGMKGNRREGRADVMAGLLNARVYWLIVSPSFPTTLQGGIGAPAGNRVGSPDRKFRSVARFALGRRVTPRLNEGCWLPFL